MAASGGKHEFTMTENPRPTGPRHGVKWPYVALVDVATIDRRAKGPEEVHQADLYVGLENITNGGQFQNVRTAGEAGLKSNKFLFTRSHVLYGKLRPYLSKIAAPEFEGICSTDILPIRPGPNLDRRYLLHYLRTPGMVSHAASKAVGINLPRLSPNVLELFQIPLPSIEEQRRIAGVLDAAEALRARRRRALAKLNSLTQAIFIKMFGHPVTNERGWPTHSLGGVCTKIQIGPFGSLLHKSDYVEDGVPLVNPMHIADGRIRPMKEQTVGIQKYSELKQYCLQVGDVVMGRRGEMGRVAVVGECEAGYVCGSGSLFLRPDPDRAIPQYIAAVLSSSRGRRQLEDSAQGVTMPNLNSDIVERFKLGVPPVHLQMRFADALVAHSELEAKQRDHADELDRLFFSLQQRAFRGEL